MSGQKGIARQQWKCRSNEKDKPGVQKKGETASFWSL